ncbi:MAG: terpene cyclase/mutase family protein [Actinomycetota bacterium]|nr:terpene cyclase/mutase family protein [Actinomycetota bacterium]
MFALLCDAVVTSPRVEVLRRLWEQDLASQVRLTYKGGFVLLAAGAAHAASLDQVSGLTISFLREQQNDDGGFGPWRNHPIGSDPWSTGVVLAGLCSLPEILDRRMVERAVRWLSACQLDSGYWAYHFIDEGTAYAYWGLSEAAKLLETA